MEKPFIFKGTFVMHPYVPLPLEDYQQKESFPYCCSFHRGVMQKAENFIESFPNCCDLHREFTQSPIFNLELYKYDGAAKDILNRLAYTEHHIARQIDQPDWYLEITNYIEYVVDSFGKPAIGVKVYTDSLSHFIQHHIDKKRLTRKKEKGY